MGVPHTPRGILDHLGRNLYQPTHHLAYGGADSLKLMSYIPSQWAFKITEKFLALLANTLNPEQAEAHNEDDPDVLIF
jgi:hypothetical protein